MHTRAYFGGADVRSCHRSNFSPGWALRRELCPLAGNSQSLPGMEKTELFYLQEQIKINLSPFFSVHS